MPDETIPDPIDVAYEVTLQDLLFGLWTVYSQTRNRIKLVSATGPARTRPQHFGQSLKQFVFGFCLGVFHLNAAGLVCIAAANVLGYLPQIAPEHRPVLSSATIVVGLIWLWLLAAPLIQKYRFQSACKARWRTNLPGIFQGPLPASIRLSATQVVSEMPDDRASAPIGPSVKLVEIGEYFLLKVKGTLVPIAKNKLSSQSVDAIRGWATAHNLLFRPVIDRHIILPLQASAWVGVALCACCLWVATHIKVVEQSAVYPTSVTLALPDATTIVAGQVVNLERLSYNASDFNGVLYDRLSGYVSRPEISGTFDMDRSATPYLAQTAAAEFAQEQGWTLTIGTIPADANWEPLPDSGVFIAWNNPSSADYPGHCGALRSNSGTIPASGDRVLWRGRLHLALCSASMSKAELRDWMLQAIQPMTRQLALRTHTNP